MRVQRGAPKSKSPKRIKHLGLFSSKVEYLVLPEAFKREVCKGFDSQAVAKVLRTAGVLIHQKDRLTNKVRLPTMGENPVSVFHISGRIFEGE